MLKFSYFFYGINLKEGNSVMKNEHYKAILENSPIGYAYHKMICNEAGAYCDYEFIDVNLAFEKLTGLKGTDVIGKRITEIIPDIAKSGFDWIATYGEIALKGGSKEFEQFQEALNKWYRVYVYSQEKGYFITWFADISKEVRELEDKTILLTSMNDIIFELDEDYTFKNIITSNDINLFLPRESIINKKIHQLFSKELSAIFIATFQRVIVSGQKEYIKYKSPVPNNNNNKWFGAEVLLKDVSGSNKKFIVSVSDITEQKKIEDELENKTAELERFFNINLDLLCIADLNGNFIKVNNAWEEILGYPVAELEKRNFLDFVHPDDMEATLATLATLEKNEQVLYFVNRYKCKNDLYRYIEWCSQPYGELIYASARDITDRKLAEGKILYLSFHDQLTGLYNRRFYEEELKRLDTERNLPLSLVMADINGLKLANDAFGHLVGDELLNKAAEAFRNECRTDEIVCRIGGDEFVIILPKSNCNEAQALVNRILTSIENQKVGLLDLSISFGCASKTNPHESIQETFKKAEENMYQIKSYESPRMREKAIQTILNTLFKKFSEEKEHSEGVSCICGRIGEQLGFNKDEIEAIKTVGILHDIGKISLNHKTLEKRGKLTDSDWNEIKRHPETGYRILNSVSETAKLSKYVLHHHERWDGSGYPDGLKGEAIPLQSRIIAIADAYIAMLSNRSYRNALTKEEAIVDIQKNAGIQFDPDIALVFLQKIVTAI